MRSRKHIFFFVLSIFLYLSAGQARAVIQLGDNVRAPYFDLFNEDIEPNSAFEQVVPGGALELLINKTVSNTLALGVGGLYHRNITEQKMYIPYAGGTPIVFPALTGSTPDVFTATGQLAPGFRDDSTHGWGGGKIGYGIATSGGVRYLVEGRGMEVRNTTTGAWVGKFIIRSINLATRAVVWTKTYTHGAIWVNVRRCKVIDIDGDGNDEVVIQTSQKTTPTTVQRYVNVFNLATGVAKRAPLTWTE